MTEPTTYSQNFVATSPKEEVRPPVIHDIRGGGKTFQWKGITAEYYGVMRWLGYIAGTVVDIYNDYQKGERNKKLDAEEAKLKANGNWNFETSEKLREQRNAKFKWHKDRIAKVEAGIFAGLTALFAWRDWRDMRRAFSGALGAESGISASTVTGGHLWNTNNPIIQSATKRWTYMNISRGLADLTFGISLNAGLIGMATRITAERTLFNQKIAYDLLEKLYQDAHLYNFNLHAPGKMAHEFANIVQAVQRDHERQPWRKETIEHYMPFFQAMAKSAVEKKIGMNETIYLLGELMTKRLTLDESLKLVDDVVTLSLDGLRKRPKEVVVVNPSKAIAEEALKQQETFDRPVENLPKEMSKSSFAEQYFQNSILSKPALERGQRSFTQMAEKSEEPALRGA